MTMTFDQLQALLTQTIVNQAQFNKEMQARHEQFSTDIQALHAAHERTEKKLNSVGNLLRTIAKKHGNYIENQGRRVEDFFIKALRKAGLSR